MGTIVSFVIAIVFAWSFKAALLEPFAIAALMEVYFRVIEGQQANPEWERKLDGASNKFHEMAGKAMDWVGAKPTGGQQPGAAI